MMMTWPPFRINLHELNNTSTLWVFVEGSESSKAKRGNENCPFFYSGQIHQLIICTVQFASASEITPFGTSVLFWLLFVACRLVSKSDECLRFSSTLNRQFKQESADSTDAYRVCRFVSFTQSSQLRTLTLTLSQTNAWSALSEVTVIVYSRGTRVMNIRSSWSHSFHSITWIIASLGVQRGGPAWILWRSSYCIWKLCSHLDSWCKERGLKVVLRTSEVRVNGAKEGERQHLIHSCPSVLFSSLSYTLDLNHYPRGLTDYIFISVFKI